MGIRAGSLTLARYKRALKSSAGRFEFLCELPLPDGHDLEALLGEVGVQVRASDRLVIGQDVLAWAAVLFCSEHEGVGGFVGPFMTALGYPSHRAATIWNQRIGPAVRDALVDWCGIKHPVGTWVYVGQVRLHAGVPKPLEPKFAALLFDIALGHGLGSVADIDCEVMDKLVTTNFQGLKFAREYLSTPSGHELIRCCAADLDRAGWPGETDISSFGSAAGYRPGLLESLYRELEKLRRTNPAVRVPRELNRSFRPQLYLDLAAQCMVLRLPGLHHPKPVRYTVEMSGRDEHPKRDVHLTDHDLPRLGKIEGTAAFGGHTELWSIPAWPNHQSSWAIFGADGEYLGSDKDMLILETGRYLLALHSDVPADMRPHLDAVRGRLGWLDLGVSAGFGDYELLEVQHGPSPVLPGIGVARGRTAPQLKAVTGTTFLPGFLSSNGVVVASGELTVVVEPWEDVDTRFFRVMHEKDGQVKDVTNTLISRGSAAIISITGQPHRGQITIERRGRQASRREPSLPYVLWREPLDLVLDQLVYGADEDARAMIAHGAEVRVDPSDQLTVPSPQIHQSLELAWQPELSEDPLLLPLKFTVPRARLCNLTHRGGCYYINLPDWSARDDVDALDSLYLWTLDGCPWTLELEAVGGGVYPLSSSDGWDNGSGRMARAQVRFSSIETALRHSGCGVGRYRLRQAGRIVSLGAYHLDTRRLQAGEFPAAEPTWMPSSLRQDLATLRSLTCLEPIELVRIDGGVAELTQALQGWQRVAWLHTGQSAHLRDPLRALARIMEEVRSTRTLACDRAQCLLAELDQIEVGDLMGCVGLAGVPTPAKLDDRIKEVRSLLQQAADFRLRIHRVVAGIREKTGAAKEAPPELVNLLEYYGRAFRTGQIARPYVQRCVYEAARLSKANVPPWSAIGEALHAMVLLRCGEVSAFLRVDTEGLPATVKLLRQHLIRPEVRAVPSVVEWDLTDLSPLPDDAALAGLLAQATDNSPPETSWLYDWVRWRLEGLVGPARDAALRDRLKATLCDQQAGTVPWTITDGARIRDELESGEPQGWI